MSYLNKMFSKKLNINDSLDDFISKNSKFQMLGYTPIISLHCYALVHLYTVIHNGPNNEYKGVICVFFAI